MMHCQWHTDTSINGMNVDGLFINEVSVSGDVSWPSNASLFIETGFYLFWCNTLEKQLILVRYKPVSTFTNTD